MNIQKTFEMCYGLSLHFKLDSYSVLKYGTHTKPATAKYESLTDAQKFRYEWLMRKYPDMQDLIYACIGCQFDDVNLQFGNRDEIHDSFLKFKGRRESMTYCLKGNISKHENCGFIPTNKLIFKYLVDEYIPEYVILLTYGTNELEDLYNSPNLLWARDKILKLMKYRDFFNANKYLYLIEKNEHNVSS